MFRGFTEAELKAFVNVYESQDAARNFLKKAGFPKDRLPEFNRVDAKTYWEMINDLLEKGILRDGRARLLAAAHDEWPANPAFEPRLFPDIGDTSAERVPPVDAVPLPSPAAPARTAGRPEPRDATAEEYGFFVSYVTRNEADRAWATWIAGELAQLGDASRVPPTVCLPDADAPPVSGMVDRTKQDVPRSAWVVAVLSPAYLGPDGDGATEWGAVLNATRRQTDRVFTVIVADCAPAGALAELPWVNLVGLDEGKASRTLRGEVLRIVNVATNYPPACR
ncbi:toll/interleukin-1 receptor domain-containing protein [Parafrankia sp. EUN1f]|uniref:toll/interleukin-1 receptor domain-containing protein n=1 Tax=Parafrankia sp. EUN1f TaxID=102897 RepID=UPI0001C45F9D|nr:toll/interleukin-1 receptor domain-containing protein [Parafrankia sp. EUN1f]EFC81475.1 hypothetical protein FrEUN1fDRAFT_5418 [Parafrankia sp. EUN1f]